MTSRDIAIEACAHMMPLGEELARKIAVRIEERIEELVAGVKAENSTLRTIVAKAKIPCVYCGLDNMAKCVHGFPGCARADDIMCGEDEAMRGMIAKIADLNRQLAAERACADAFRRGSHEA